MNKLYPEHRVCAWESLKQAFLLVFIDLIFLTMEELHLMVLEVLVLFK